MSEVLIKVEHVSKKFCKDLKKSLWYGIRSIVYELLGKDQENYLRDEEFWAVKDVSFELKRGECLGLIGHNGAGKSTLLKMMNGLIKPNKGKITLKGKIGALIELGAGFNPVLTGRENIYINGAILGFSKKDIEAKFEEIVSFAELEDYIDSPVQNYSSGMKVRLGFSIAAQMEPDILLIDEILAVGDLGFKVKCMNKIIKLMSKSAVILVSHSMPNIARVCDRVLLLENGKIRILENNIGKAISLYESLFKTEKSLILGDINSFSIRKMLINSKEINIKNESFEKQVIGILRLDKGVILEITFCLNKGFNSLQIVWFIIDKTQRALGISSTQKFNNLQPNKNYTVKVEINDLLLARGIYSFGLNIYNYKNKKRDVIKRYLNIIDFEYISNDLVINAPLSYKNQSIIY